MERVERDEERVKKIKGEVERETKSDGGERERDSEGVRREIWR